MTALHAPPMSASGVVSAPRPTVRAALAVSWRPWLAVHAVVAVGLGVTLLLDGPHFPTAGDGPDARGLFAWDGAWYRGISNHGYDALDPQARRFFPLLPLLGRGLALLAPDRLAVWLVSSACALAFLTAFALLAARLTGESASMRRVTWTAALIPGGAALALPYTESVAGLVTALFLLSLESRRRSGAVAGLLAGLARPTGVLLCLPALLRSRRPSWPTVAVLAAAPALGTAALLAYSRVSTGSWTTPYDSQGVKELRGGVLANPLPQVLRGSPGGIGPVATLALIAVSLWLLWRVLRTLPLAYGAWSALTLLLAVCSVNAHSLPRYVAGILPMVLVLALAPRSERAFRLLLVVCAGLSVVLTTMWLRGLVVP